MNSKIALITGASRGLGRNAALHLARQGRDLLLTYHSRREEAEAVVAEIEQLGRKAAALRLDVGDSASFAAFAEQVRTLLAEQWQRTHLDFLVNNAGIGIHTPFTETGEAQFDQLMGIHLKGPFFLTQQLLPLIENDGAIINVSTGLTRFTVPGYAAYATMKGGIEALTRYLAKELGPRGIRVNVIAPGAIETDFGGGRLRSDAQLKEFLTAQTALGRTGVPDDIGGAIAALLSDDCRWVNAQRIEASGGMFL